MTELVKFNFDAIIPPASQHVDGVRVNQSQLRDLYYESEGAAKVWIPVIQEFKDHYASEFDKTFPEGYDYIIALTDNPIDGKKKLFIRDRILAPVEVESSDPEEIDDGAEDAEFESAE